MPARMIRLSGYFGDPRRAYCSLSDWGAGGIGPPGSAKNFSPPLETKIGFANFFGATDGGVRAPHGPGPRRRAPVVSGAARNQLALWRNWLCALTIYRPFGVRPLA